MKRLLLLSLCLVLAGALATNASAVLLIGGHDETSENMANAWFTAAPTPAPSVIHPPGAIQPRLLISEFRVDPTAGEFIEICNPTGSAVDLSSTYLSDDWFLSGPPYALPPVDCYCHLPRAGYKVNVNSDFNVKFPNGAVILPWQTLVIAVQDNGFFATYGFHANFEIVPSDATVPDMVNVGSNTPGTALLTNTAEALILYHWDGQSDNVCDDDYVAWDDATPQPERYVDKTLTAVDGPDADAIATPFLADTPQNVQIVTLVHGANASNQRYECTEFQELPGPGNGCTFGATPTVKGTWGQLKTLYR